MFDLATIQRLNAEFEQRDQERRARETREGMQLLRLENGGPAEADYEDEIPGVAL